MLVKPFSTRSHFSSMQIWSEPPKSFLPALKNASRSMCTHRNNPNILKSWWFWNSRDDQCAFLANSLLKGHQRSLESTNSFINNSWLKRDRTLGWLHCVCLIKTHRLICHMTHFDHHVTLTWGQILNFTFIWHSSDIFPILQILAEFMAGDKISS